MFYMYMSITVCIWSWLSLCKFEKFRSPGSRSGWKIGTRSRRRNGTAPSRQPSGNASGALVQYCLEEM